MRVLVVGQGGREHALVKSLSPEVSPRDLHAIPGSAGMADEATCHPEIRVEASALLQFCRDHNIDLVVIGPEQPLVDGLYDVLSGAGVLVVGCGRNAARLEGSKIFSKEFMLRAGVPTATAQVVSSVSDLESCYQNFTPPYVLKADGLAGGKGVFLVETPEELISAGRKLFEERTLGDSGRIALLEQFQPGYELSVFVLTNGTDYKILPLAQDHKRLRDGQEGPNTGGMGTIAPMDISPDLFDQIEKRVVAPSIAQLGRDNLEYRGVLFIGLMVTPDGPSVLEYNVRWGDPEAQVLLPLLEGSWLEVFTELAKGELTPMKFKDIFATCVVLAAPGYPDVPEKGVPISFSENSIEGAYFLHAGTSKNKAGGWITQGGRVLNAVATATTREKSIEAAYKQAQSAQWVGLQMRTDIGRDSLRS